MRDRTIAISLAAVLAVSACEDGPARAPESVDSWLVSLDRGSFRPASLPAEPAVEAEGRRFVPADRAFVAWHRPVPAVTAGDLSPWADEDVARDVLPALQLELVGHGETTWGRHEFAGVMRGFAHALDLSEAVAVEFWMNDFTGDGSLLDQPREGVLHLDFGWINEDFWWPRDEDGSLTRFTFQTEDRDGNGYLGFPEGQSEDTGLDGIPSSGESTPLWPQRPGRDEDPAGDDYDPRQWIGEAGPFLYLNGGERNQRMDHEDVNFNGVFTLLDGYFTFAVDLADPQLPLIDIYRDYQDHPDFLAEARAKGDAWRKYWFALTTAQARRALFGDGYDAIAPDWSRVHFLRIWYENPDGDVRSTRRSLVLTQLRMVPREEPPNNPLGLSPPRAGE
jgi:hypothetical protein